MAHAVLAPLQLLFALLSRRRAAMLTTTPLCAADWKAASASSHLLGSRAIAAKVEDKAAETCKAYVLASEHLLSWRNYIIHHYIMRCRFAMVHT